MIKYVKLIDGDEIIGDVMDEKSKIVIFNPLQIQIHEVESEKFQIYMMDYGTYTVSNNIEIPKSSVMWSGNVSQEILDYYFNSLKFIQKNLKPRIQKSIVTASVKLRTLLDNDSNSESDIIINTTKH